MPSIIEYMIASMFIIFFLVGVFLDVVLSLAVVALYTSFLKRLIAYYKVTGLCRRAMKRGDEKGASCLGGSGKEG